MPVALLAVSWFAIDWSEEGSDEYPGGVVLRDSAGEVLRVSLGEGDVDCRPYYHADPEDWIVKALVAVEDGTYWEHHGVRPLSALRALFQNVFYRRRISGASTITMQTVRLIKPHPKTHYWKFKEAILALKMERKKDKLWILSQYLNRAPYGSNFIGIEAAANGWFGKSAKQLGLGEAAMLAAMVQAPSRYRPDRGFDLAFRRRDYVLSRMLKLGYIDQDQFDAARSVRPVVCRSPRPFKHPYYCDYFLHRLGRDRAAQRHSGDYVTPLDANIQATCEQAVNSAALDGGWSVAAVVERVSDGAVVALTCSGDYFSPDAGQFNTALAPRPAGSTLKPFLTALAFDIGCATPEERLDDSPVSYRGYSPANFNSKYRGSVTVRNALIESLNIPFVRLLNRVGVGRFAAKLRQLGFSHLNGSDEDYGLGMAIGNVEVTLTELVDAYAILARGGDGIFSRGASYLISDILSGTERSSSALGHIADVVTPNFAWKTGTSSAYRDAWTVVWNPEYVIGVWCGHMRGGFGDKTLVGARSAAPIAWGIARSLYPQQEGPWFVEPGEIIRREICSLTGLPATADCPDRELGRAINGRSSAKPCERHRRFPANSSPALKPPRLELLSPVKDSVYVVLEGMNIKQQILCKVTGNAEGEELWWFVDDIPRGKSVGNSSFAIDLKSLSIGRHTIVGTRASGELVSAEITLQEQSIP